jgi:AcrR family transcriptional regulator
VFPFRTVENLGITANIQLQNGYMAIRLHKLVGHSRPPKPRKYPQQSRSKMLVVSIQQACIEVYERNGANNVTMNLIAQHSGVSKGSIYQYFDGIEGIIASIYERVVHSRCGLHDSWGLKIIDKAGLAHKLVEFDALFARNYYRDFYRHALMTDSAPFAATAYGAVESA